MGDRATPADIMTEAHGTARSTPGGTVRSGERGTAWSTRGSKGRSGGGDGARCGDGGSVIHRCCSPSRREVVALLALVLVADDLKVPAHQIAAVVEGVGSAVAVVEGRLSGFEVVDARLADTLYHLTTPAHLEHAETMVEQLAAEHPDVRLVTVLDPAYPLELRGTFDRTPVLFVRGALEPDARCAVVGTRHPSPAGVEQASRLAGALASAGVTVVSGLAAGIDTAAHRASLDAGGCTVAVLGHGIAQPVYPAENAGLAGQIVASGGAVVSQFCPASQPSPGRFLLRNVTTSGLAEATVVVEATATSGARQAARRCLEHKKQLFLLQSLVATEDWARRYAQRPGATVVRDADEVLTYLAAPPAAPQPVQLVLG